MTIKLKEIAYTLEYDANLIFLGQLHDNKITYVNNVDAMTLMQGGYFIAHTKQNQNFFILDLVMPNKVIQAIAIQATNAKIMANLG